MSLIVSVRMPCGHYVAQNNLYQHMLLREQGLSVDWMGDLNFAPAPRIFHDVGASLVDKMRVLPPGYT